jgi:thiamine pyrophosphate-dependent acetolactate synthase large subunit-like protein
MRPLFGGLAPIVLLLNNSSYGMLEAIDRPRNYYTRRSWDYAAMARALGASAERVTTPAELEGPWSVPKPTRALSSSRRSLLETTSRRSWLASARISTPHQSPGLFEVKTWCAAAHGRRR